MRATREAIALMNLPREAAAILPGFGWRPPDEGFMKINTDGALSFAEARGGAGGVARSSTSLLGSWCKPYLGVSDPLTTEAFALRDGVRFAALRGFSHVSVEVDCLELVKLWNTRHNSRSIVAPILPEIKELSNIFSSFSLLRVNRDHHRRDDMHEAKTHEREFVEGMNGCDAIIDMIDHLEEKRLLSRPNSSLRVVVIIALQRAMRQKVLFWKQRWKVKAVIDGVENNKFFHVSASQRFQKNSIAILEDNGVEFSSHDSKAAILHNFFHNLLGTSKALT
ncbi:Casein kinase I-2-like protein [Hordeum vulgare]|nr:Casein kinase I-2-like protein [Hordeum vulgare]